MEASHWDFHTWRDLIESGVLIATLLLSVYTSRRVEKAQKVTNLIAMTQLHNELWREPSNNPHLARISDPNADIRKLPVTQRESDFIERLIVHLSTAYRAQKDGVFTKIDGLEGDVKQFFSLPVPKAVWDAVKSYQDLDFVSFIESCLKTQAN